MYKIQKLFHIERWWGKILFIFFFNILFFLLGILVYNLFLNIGRSVFDLLSDEFFEKFYLLILLPFLSFVYLIKIFKKFGIEIKKVNLFFLNLFIIFLIFLSFFLIVYFSISPNFF